MFCRFLCASLPFVVFNPRAFCSFKTLVGPSFGGLNFCGYVPHFRCLFYETLFLLFKLMILFNMYRWCYRIVCAVDIFVLFISIPLFLSFFSVFLFFSFSCLHPLTCMHGKMKSLRERSNINCLYRIYAYDVYVLYRKKTGAATSVTAHFPGGLLSLHNY